MVLMMACNRQPSLTLLHTKQITFPSASAIEFYNNKLYVFGDDATYLLVLNNNYSVADTLHYLNDTASRISKSSKPDMESAVITHPNGMAKVMAFSSGSTSIRNFVFEMDLEKPSSFSFSPFSYQTLVKNLAALPEINLEGATRLGAQWLFSNRANTTHRFNHFIICDSLPWIENLHPPLIQKLMLDTTAVTGISGLYYLREKDILFFTASEEATPNAVLDGAIGDSHFGWIENYSTQLNKSEITPSGILNLTDMNAAFAGQKIESLTMESFSNNVFVFHLAADNDDGSSGLFKVMVRL